MVLRHGEGRAERAGLLTATVAVSALVDTIIEAPGRGWSSAPTLLGFALALAVGAAFVRTELRQGFIFLITQYFQFIRGYGALSTGARILPVALSIGASSIIGANLAPRIGTRRIVVTGLILLGGSFLWISQIGSAIPYTTVVVQMLMMGTGLGLTTAPATESILAVLPPAKAGVGSAVNDATREAGGTLGVAIIGSVYTSLYASGLAHSVAARLPRSTLALAQSSVGAGSGVARQVSAQLSHPLIGAVQSAFLSGLHAGCLVAAGVCALGAGGALMLPGRRLARQTVPLATPHIV